MAGAPDSAMTATDANALRSLLVEFVRDASTEITVHDDALLPQLRDLLGPGTVVYVAHTPKASIDEVCRRNKRPANNTTAITKARCTGNEKPARPE